MINNNNNNINTSSLRNIWHLIHSNCPFDISSLHCKHNEKVLYNKELISTDDAANNDDDDDDVVLSNISNVSVLTGLKCSLGIGSKSVIGVFSGCWYLSKWKNKNMSVSVYTYAIWNKFYRWWIMKFIHQNRIGAVLFFVQQIQMTDGVKIVF